MQTQREVKSMRAAKTSARNGERHMLAYGNWNSLLYNFVQVQYGRVGKPPKRCIPCRYEMRDDGRRWKDGGKKSISITADMLRADARRRAYIESDLKIVHSERWSVRHNDMVQYETMN